MRRLLALTGVLVAGISPAIGQSSNVVVPDYARQLESFPPSPAYTIQLRQFGGAEVRSADESVESTTSVAEDSRESAQPRTDATSPSNGSIDLGEPDPPTPPAVPPGFENLAQDIPEGFEAFFQEQTTQVDVYYGGLYVTSALATYDPTSVAFLNPEEVLMQLPGIDEADIPAVLQALSGKLPTHEGARCLARSESNCGIIYPDVAGVIFDSSRFRADVFVSPDYLALQAHQINRFLGPSDAGFSAFQTLNYAFSGSDASSDLAQNLNSRLLISYAETSLLITGNYSENNDFELDDLRVRRDWQGIRYEGGFINNYGTAFQFGRRFDILGVSVGSSFDTREDLRFSTGNTIEIYLPLQSTVLLYVDERLVSSQQLPPGNQQLDTSSLPGGSYDVEIRIRDASGERTETRFYTKNAQLPPEGEHLFSFTAGVLREDTSKDPFAIEDTVVWRGSYQARLNDNSAWKIGIAGTSDDLMNQIGWFNANRFFEISTSVAAASNQRFGANFEFRIPLFDNVLSASVRKIWNKAEFEGSDGAYLLGQTSAQYNFGYAIQIFSGTLNLSARLNERGGERNEVYSAGYRLPAWRFNSLNISPRLNVTSTNLGLSTVFTMDFRQNAESWQYNGNLRGERLSDDGISENSGYASVGANWRSDPNAKTDMTANFSANRDKSSSNLLSSADWRTAYGRARINARYTNSQTGSSSTSYGGNYATGIVYSSGGLSFGGAQQNRSAIIIDLSDVDVDDAYFDVIVNGGKKGTASPGRRTIIPVSPYDQYRVSLSAQGAGFVAFNNQSRLVTLYPGNAVTLTWDIKDIDVVFGRLVDANGEPVNGAVLGGVEGLAVSDNYGNFQAEMAKQTRELSGQTRTSQCEISVPKYTTRQGIGLLGDLVCELKPK